MSTKHQLIILFIDSVGKTEGDGGKWFCAEYFKQTEECVIFSIGSNGDFSFEESMNKMTGGRCKVFLESTP